MNNEIVLFEAKDGKVALPVQVNAETVWLTQAQMAQLFDRSQSVIARHINNAFAEGEVNREEAYAKIAYLAENASGTAKVAIYNLDVIISVGYRVHSQRGVEFPQAQPPPAAQGRLQAYCGPHACSLNGDDRRIKARRKGNDGQSRHDFPRVTNSLKSKGE